eukprot:scaffold32864_cov28-Tisochrysis_lutea.AAC.2
MLYGDVSKHGATPVKALTHRSNVAPPQVGAPDRSTCCPKPAGSMCASARLKSSVTPEWSERTWTVISTGGNLPAAASWGLLAVMRGSSQRRMRAEKMSATACCVRTRGGSTAVRLGKW